MQTYQELKEYQRENRDNWGQGIGIRVHRALSWLQRAEQERPNNNENHDVDAEFIFLWIAFNAAYANQHSNLTRSNTRDDYTQFFDRLLMYDTNQFYSLMWSHFPATVRSLLNNPYVFQPFWDSVNGVTEPEAWKVPFEAAKRAANQALGQQDTLSCLSIVMERLYTLRNQLIHGGATWNGSYNREQLRNATSFMRELMPIVLGLMMQHGSDVWGDAVYIAD